MGLDPTASKIHGKTPIVVSGHCIGHPAVVPATVSGIAAGSAPARIRPKRRASAAKPSVNVSAPSALLMNEGKEKEEQFSKTP